MVEQSLLSTLAVNYHLDGVWFSGNAALGNGGAVCLDASYDYDPFVISFVNTTFTIIRRQMVVVCYLYDGAASISDSLFRQNNAGLGGGICNLAFDFYNSGLTVERTTFWENNSLSGGALYNENAHLMLINDTLASNTADSGGGAYNTGGGLLEILNSTLAYNRAGQSDQLLNDQGQPFTHPTASTLTVATAITAWAPSPITVTTSTTATPAASVLPAA